MQPLTSDVKLDFPMLACSIVVLAQKDQPVVL